MIKVGLMTHAGGAHVGAYLQALAATEECAEVLLADPDGRWEEESRRVLGDKLTHVAADHRQLLASHSPQLALVTMEALLAPPVIAAALDAGCHVFAEKPACVRAEDFEPLVERADQRQRYLMLALANRTNPEIAAARQLVQDGVIGPLFGLEMHLIADQTRLTRPAYHQQWFADRTRAGGGHLIWLGIHWLDLAMYVTGLEITDVAGFTSNVGGQPLNIEDAATAALQFDTGALGTMTSGYYLDKGYHSHIKLWGGGGWLLIEPLREQPLSWYENSGDKAGQVQTWDGAKEPRGYTPFVRAAIRAAAGLAEPPISNAHSLRALQTVFSIYESARTGRAMRVA